MADELNRWLDRETAERLLRGEPLEAVDPADRDQAERLAKTLEALTAEPAPTCEELPGEAAALAAFRAARAGRDTTAATPGIFGGQAAGDVGLVCLGGPGDRHRRPRWGRPVRLALAAALAVGMVGGVAVAAGTGVLPTPFDDEPARPAATVPAPPATEQPLVSPSPGQDTPEGTGPGGSVASADPGATEDPKHSGPEDDKAGGDGRHGSGGWWRAVVSSCRDIRDGKALSGERRRALTGAAGGRDRVRTYCEKVLRAVGARIGDDAGDDRDRDKGRGHGGDDGRHDDGDWGDRGDTRHDDEDDAPNGLTRGDDGSGDGPHPEGDGPAGRGAPRSATTASPTASASAASR
ncbi:hypothetical protein ACFV46_02470 [Streptomyces sp. NPDC059852]|uniref:hypothetical protein n=1 Tax=Streptomyces sp. NPDC059852 TaxID=3346972 RepID=UPI00364CE851